MSVEMKKLSGDRGVIFLETAFVLPIFMILLCLTVDLPRIMSARQRLMGAGRVIAEIRARNNTNQLLDSKTLKGFFFDANSADSIKLHISYPSTQYSIFGDLPEYIEDHWGAFGKIVSFLANLISGGNFKPYFLNVFNKDNYYGARVSATMPTILPSEAYTAFVQHGAPSDEISSPYDCYMPNIDSCKYTGKSFIDDMLNWLHDHFGI